MPPKLPSWSELTLVAPELWLVGGMCAVLLVAMMNRGNKSAPTFAALASLLLALIATCFSLTHSNTQVFSGMLSIDPFSQFFKIILLVFAMLLVVQWMLGGRDELDSRDVPDFLCLILGATFGMALMASASNLLMIFVALEAASYPSYALAGFRKASRTSAEGALKYVLFGSAASAVMLYGMSLIYGSTGSLALSALGLAATTGMTPMLAIGIAALFVGIAFKLSAVPVHFWCPDVFQGAPVEVTTLLAIGSKGAAVALLLRVCTAMGEGSALAGTTPMLGIAVALAAVGAVSATWGNLVAFHQDNVKRMLAYSSIAHGGYMVMTAALAVIAQPGPAQREVASSLLFYIVVYLFMNLGAFTVAAMIAQSNGGEESGYDIKAYAGLSRRAPAMVILMAVFLLSLVGVPPLGGFWGKMYLAFAMLHSAGPWAMVLIGVLLLNTIISLYYYLRPVYYMVFVRPEREPSPVLPGTLAVGLLAVCLAGVLWTGILPGQAGDMAHDYSALAPAARAPEKPVQVRARDATHAGLQSFVQGVAIPATSTDQP